MFLHETFESYEIGAVPEVPELQRAEKLVHYRTAVALHKRLEASGNKCDLITVPVGGHSFTSDSKEWKTKLHAKLEEMLKREGLLPAVAGR